jgi:drug/metabolite transporter (DMT)-like permease
MILRISKIKGSWFALLAVIGWGGFNVSTQYALSVSHFYPNDLTMLRYCLSGLLCVPLFFLYELQKKPVLFWAKGGLLSMVAGPGFGWLVNLGIDCAPLTHSSVMVPTISMLVTMLAANCMGERIKMFQWIGAGIVILGLFKLINTPFSGTRPLALRGDELFTLAALLWVGFTVALKCWQIDAMHAVVMINIISGLVYLPLFLLQPHHGFYQFSLYAWVNNGIVQGVISSILVIYAYTKCVKYWGASMASVLPALIPVTSLLIQYLIFSSVPEFCQLIALGVIFMGVIIIMLHKH